jgi:hypothetical protein
MYRDEGSLAAPHSSDAHGRRDTSSVGQAMEFRIWTMLIEQSRGALHVFLPLLDRGLDGVIHRLTDGEYIPVQVKSRGSTVESMVEIVIRGDSLVDDRALIIAGLHTAEDLGPTLLVVDEATFKRMAAHDLSKGKDIYSSAFSMRANKGTHWRPYLVSRDQLAERLLGGPPPARVAWNEPTPKMDPSERHNGWLGFLGEQEVIRRLAENPRLDLFRPFPDLEMVEVLVRNNATCGFMGIQVKAAEPLEWGEAHFRVRKATFVAAPTTYLAGLAWLPATNTFVDECLLVPTMDLASVAIDVADYWVLDFHPHSPEKTRLDNYRVRLSELASRVEAGCRATG